jgi:flavorubredoxin
MTELPVYYSDPRRIEGTDDQGVYWIQECLDAATGFGEYLTNDPQGQAFAEGWYEPGDDIHISINAFLFIGEDETLLFETLSPNGTDRILGALEQLLDGRDLDYLVPSHDEAPHAGNAHHIMDAYPEATLVECTAKGASPHLHKLVYGDATAVTYGDTIDLGGYTVEFVKPVFLDSAMSTWLFESTTGMLCTVDSFGFPHHADKCTCFADEFDTAVTSGQMMQYTGRSLQWIEYADNDKIKAELDHTFATYQPTLIAPSHGSLIRADIDRHVDLIKDNVDWVREHGHVGQSFGEVSSQLVG